MAKRTDISAEYARQLLDYDPETGIMKWRYRPSSLFATGTGRYTAEAKAKTWNKRWAGKVVGRPNAKGYLLVCVEYITYRMHHLAWLMETGEWPKDQLDHRDGITGNNILKNLREATGAENQQNLKKYDSNTSGYIGVSWHKQASKWAANINHEGRHYSLGLFEDAEKAYEAYLAAKEKYHQFQPVPREA